MNKDFDNERDARLFRDSKRQEGLAASMFTYGKDRYRIKVWELWDIYPERTQRALSNRAWELSRDVEDLTKTKELIASPDFGSEIEDTVFVAKVLHKDHWFKYPEDVIKFFDGVPDKEMDKIKEMVDTALQEYEDEWNDKQGQ